MGCFPRWVQRNNFRAPSPCSPMPSPAWRGCRRSGGCGGDTFPFIPGSVECSRPISKPLRFFKAWRSTFSAPLHTRPGFAGPPSPSRRGLLLCPVSCFRFMQSLPEHSFLLSTQISQFPALSCLERVPPAAAGVEGTPSLLYQSPSSAPDRSLGLCVFPGLEVNFFGSPPHPARLRRSTLSKQERAFTLSRRLYSSSPKQASQIAWHTLRNC